MIKKYISERHNKKNNKYIFLLFFYQKLIYRKLEKSVTAKHLVEVIAEVQLTPMDQNFES